MEHTHHGFVWRKTYGDVEIPNAIKLTRADLHTCVHRYVVCV